MSVFIKSVLFPCCTQADKVFFSLVLVLACLSLVLIAIWSPEGRVAVIEINGKPFAKVYLSEPQQIVAPGKLGEMLLVVEDHHLRVQQSFCPQKICMHAGPISRQGELLVCVPNQVVVRIAGDKANPFDLITP